MIWIAVIGLLWLSCFGFYVVSEKQILKTRKSHYAFLADFPTYTKFAAGIFLFVAMVLLRTRFSYSISFVALWVFLSPVLFIFILKMNKAFQYLFKIRKQQTAQCATYMPSIEPIYPVSAKPCQPTFKYFRFIILARIKNLNWQVFGRQDSF